MIFHFDLSVPQTVMVQNALRRYRTFLEQRLTAASAEPHGDQAESYWQARLDQLALLQHIFEQPVRSTSDEQPPATDRGVNGTTGDSDE